MRFRNTRASLTVEATIVFSAVLLVVIAVIYFCLMLYQKIYLQSFTEMVAARAANNYSYLKKDMLWGYIEKSDFSEVDLYWRIYDSNKEKRITKIKDFAVYHFGKFSLLPGTKNPQNIMVDIKITPELLFGKKITVTIVSYHHNPVGSLLRVFGMKNMLSFSSTAEASISEPAEFIRNTDFAIDTAREIDNKYLGSEGQKKIDLIQKGLSKIFDTIKYFKGGS